MSLKDEQKHLPILIAICFVGNFILGGVGQACDNGSFGQLFSWQWGSLLFMAGASLFAVKLATDKWHISSAGFVLLSIGQGIIFTLQDPTTNKEAETLFASAIMVFFPGMVFICYYSGFPRWLRIGGLLSMMPFLVSMIKIDSHKFDLNHDQWINVAGFILIQLIGICWSYFAIRPHRNTKVQHQ
jgi:hypothetical protein